MTGHRNSIRRSEKVVRYHAKRTIYGRRRGKQNKHVVRKIISPSHRPKIKLSPIYLFQGSTDGQNTPASGEDASSSLDDSPPAKVSRQDDDSGEYSNLIGAISESLSKSFSNHPSRVYYY